MSAGVVIVSGRQWVYDGSFRYFSSIRRYSGVVTPESRSLAGKRVRRLSRVREFGICGALEEEFAWIPQ